jgi:hypothetical protein
LAEVMSDNSPKVGEILQLYEIEGEHWDGGGDKESIVINVRLGRKRSKICPTIMYNILGLYVS